MADRIKPVALAKELNIRPQIIYGLIKRGKIHTYDNPAGGPALIDPSEARIIVSRMHVRGPHKEKRTASSRPPKGIVRGSILSHERAPTQGPYARPAGPRRIWQITDPGQGSGSVVWGADGARGIVWSSDGLADKLKAGVASIENVPALLGMIAFQWQEEGSAELAKALQEWCVINGVLFHPMTHTEEHEHVDPDEPAVKDDES